MDNKIKKHSIYIACLVVILLVGCSQKYTFESGLKEIEAIDAKHDTSIYSERLDKVMLNTWDIEDMLADLNAMELRLKNSENKDSEDIQALLLLVEFRKKMLEAEMEMIKVRYIGAKGDIMDGFKCKDIGYIVNSSLIKKMAVYKGAAAMNTFDKLTGFSVASESINRENMEFDNSDVKKLLDQANQGIYLGESFKPCLNETDSSTKTQ